MGFIKKAFPFKTIDHNNGDTKKFETLQDAEEFINSDDYVVEVNKKYNFYFDKRNCYDFSLPRYTITFDDEE